MRKYLTFFKMRYLAVLQYRTAALAGIMTQFAWGFGQLMMFAAFYRSDPSAFPMEYSQLASYIWLQQATIALFSFWGFDPEILESITSGQISYELCRPQDIYCMWFTKSLSTRVARVSLRVAPIFIVAFLLPAPYGLRLPPDFFSAVMFFIAMTIAALLTTALNMLVYISSFSTVNNLGVRVLSNAVVEVLSGMILPIPFFPDKIRVVLEILPFGSMQNVPLRVYSGQIAGAQAVSAVLLQAFWLAAILLLGYFWISKSLKKVVIQGG